MLAILAELLSGLDSMEQASSRCGGELRRGGDSAEDARPRFRARSWCAATRWSAALTPCSPRARVVGRV